MSADLLQAVVAGSRRSADAREAAHDRAAFDRSLAARTARGAAFRASLVAPGIRVIAECKRRSPSRGVLRAAYDPVAIASSYEAAGAAAISVLTEPTFFDGSLEDLSAVRAAVTVPLLRKDFLVTPFQVREAAAAGADAVLLIVAAMDDDRQMTSLLAVAASCHLAVLVEVHDSEELHRAVDVGAQIVGVNSRNLRTLAVDPGVFDTLAPAIPRHVIAVAESGLKAPADVRRLKALRYDAFLIGERFMSVADPGHALASVIAGAEGGES